MLIAELLVLNRVTGFNQVFKQAKWSEFYYYTRLPVTRRVSIVSITLFYITMPKKIMQ